jgi:hypothetical protein
MDLEKWLVSYRYRELLLMCVALLYKKGIAESLCRGQLSVYIQPEVNSAALRERIENLPVLR